MRFPRLLSFIFFIMGSNYALSDVEHYFSSIRNNPDALYQFFKEMPKGGELHYHLAGGALPEEMLKLAPSGNYCIDKSTYTIQIPNDANTDKHQCNGLLLNHLKKNSPLYRKILRAWSLKDFKEDHESGHDHFFASFFKFFPIVSQYSPDLLATVIKRAAKQNELYLEVMVLPDDARSAQFGKLVRHIPLFKEKQAKLLANADMQDNIRQTIANSQTLLTKTREKLGCNRKDKDPACNLTVRLQYIILREQPLNSFFAQALNGFAATEKSKNLVSINLVQAEDGPLSLQDYHKQMQILRFLHRAYPNVHIALHAGELRAGKLGATEVKPQELSYHIDDAIHVGKAERIGHGVDIDSEKHAEKLLRYMSQKEIPVEINLTSNQKLLRISAKQHPIRHYLRHHVPVILSTDDEGILRTNLTKEYVKASTEQKLNYAILKAMNRNTLTYSFLPGKSLWKDAINSTPIDACTQWDSPRCLAFIAINQKAKLQWNLEKALLTFENQYRNQNS